MRAVLKRTLVILGYAVGSILVLLLLAYVVLLVINRNDQPPSDLVVEIKQRAEQRQREVADEHNAYIYLMGFGTEPNNDPFELGRARVEWMQTAGPSYPIERDPGHESFDFNGVRTEPNRKLANTCGVSLKNCARKLQDVAAAQDRVNSERWLIDRYRTLLSYDRYQEKLPFDGFAPTPPFAEVFGARRVYFVDARMSGAAGNHARAKEAIQQDQRFWLNVLREADTLLSKMIAVSAIRQHFALGNFALSGLPAEAIPDGWRQPLSMDTRSMHRALEGEWMHFETLNNRLASEYGDAWRTHMLGPEPTPPAEWLGALLNPLLQRQDLSNRHAQLMRNLAMHFDVPLSEMPDAMSKSQRTFDEAYSPFSSLYNPMGNIMMDITAGIGLYHDYAARVADLEGLRRIALLAAKLRAKGVDAAGVPQKLLQAELRNPYTNEPFEWDAEARAMVFRGLERTSRGRHAIVY